MNCSRDWRWAGVRLSGFTAAAEELPGSAMDGGRCGGGVQSGGSGVVEADVVEVDGDGVRRELGPR